MSFNVRPLPVLFAVMLAASSAFAADVVVVSAPKGAPAKVGNAFVDAVKKEVAPAKTVKIPPTKAVKASDRTAALAAACASKKASYGIDAVIEGKKRLSVIAVSANGDTVYEKTAALPKAPAKQRAAILEAARNVGRAIKDQTRSTTPDTPKPVATAEPLTQEQAQSEAAAANNGNADAYGAGVASPWTDTGTPSGAATPPITEPAGKTETAVTTSKPKERASSSSSGGGRGDFRIALGALGGGGGYKESIDSTRNQGDRDVKISMAPQFGGQLELEHAVGFRLGVNVLKQSATLKPDVTDGEDISVDSLNIGGRASFALTHGDIPFAIMLGGSYEKVDAGTQPDVLWVPSNKLFTTVVGVTVSHGDLTTNGATFEAGVGLVPYGKHTRTADTVETSSRALGGTGWLRGRYQFPKLLGSSAGLFLEAGGNLRYLTMSPSAVTLPAEDGQTRTLSLPVGDDSSNRLDYGLTASVGLMWRPGD